MNLSRFREENGYRPLYPHRTHQRRRRQISIRQRAVREESSPNSYGRSALLPSSERRRQPHPHQNRQRHFLGSDCDHSHGRRQVVRYIGCATRRTTAMYSRAAPAAVSLSICSWEAARRLISIRLAVMTCSISSTNCAPLHHERQDGYWRVNRVQLLSQDDGLLERSRNRQVRGERRLGAEKGLADQRR